MRLRDFVLIEFARAWQEDQGAARVDPEVASITRADGRLPPVDDRDGRLLLYSEHLLRTRLTDTDGVRGARGLGTSLGLALAVVPLLGALAGGGMLQAALPPNDLRPVNVLHLVAEGVLLPSTFLLWTVVLSRLLARRTGALHWVAWALGAVQARALGTAVGRLAGRVLRRSGIAVDLFARYSHLFWVGAIGAFVGLGLWRFLFDDYQFAWSSTLPITGDGVRRAFELLVAPVGWLPGVEAPTAAQVTLSEYGSLSLSGGSGGAYVTSTADPMADQALRKAWWSVMLAVVACWGLLPRLVALGLTSWRIRRGVARALKDPTSQVILDALDPPPAAPIGSPVQPSLPDVRPHRAATPAPMEARAGRGLDVVVFATEAPARALLDGVGLGRLGLSSRQHLVRSDDDDPAMEDIVGRLAGPEAPEGAVLVFDVGSIPDGLKEDFLRDCVAALGPDAPVHVLLTGLARFRASPRGRDDARLEAWRRLAARAGVAAPRVHIEGSRP